MLNLLIIVCLVGAVGCYVGSFAAMLRQLDRLDRVLTFSALAFFVSALLLLHS